MTKPSKSAKESGYKQNAAIACELAAGLYASEERMKVARAYMLDAISLYNRWGAHAKILEIKKRHSHLFQGFDEERKDHREVRRKDITTTDNNQETSARIDVYTIKNAMDSILSQSDLDTLQQTFLKVVMEVMNANKGFVIIETDDELFIEAAKYGNTAVDNQIIPLEQAKDLSILIVRFVARSLEQVVINNNDQIGIFVKDPYFDQTRSGSVLCTPLLCGSIPIGVLYLENQQMPGNFTEDRLAFIELLLEQIANNKLFQEHLKDKVFQKETELLSYVEPLTERESEVLQLISAGFSNKEIGEKLEMTVNTVKTHVKNIYGKLQVNRRVQAVEKAKQLGLL